MNRLGANPKSDSRKAQNVRKPRWRSPWSLDEEWREPDSDEPHPPVRRQVQEVAPGVDPGPALVPRARIPQPVARFDDFDEPDFGLRPLRARAPAPGGSRAQRARPQPVLRTPVFYWKAPLLILIGLCGMVALAWLYWQDSQPTPDFDLRLTRTGDEVLVIQAPKRLQALLDSAVPVGAEAAPNGQPWEWSTPQLADFVKAKGTVFDNLRDLLEDYDWYPRHTGWFVTDLAAHPSWPRLTLLLQAQVAYLMRRGEEESAFTTAIDMVELGRRLQEIEAWPGYMTRALDIHAASTRTLAELLKVTRLEGPRLWLFQKEFQDCAPALEILDVALKSGYMHEKKLLLGTYSGEPDDRMPGGARHMRFGGLLFKINETLALFTAAFRSLRAEAAEVRDTPSFAGGDQRRVRQTAPQFYRPNAGGERHFSDRIDLYLKWPESYHLAIARHALISTLFGVRRFVADKQRLPRDLVELQPDYLVSLPEDPFSGRPVEYNGARHLLHSVGTNGVAEGGISGPEALIDPREPTVELGIAPTAVVE